MSLILRALTLSLSLIVWECIANANGSRLFPPLSRVGLALKMSLVSGDLARDVMASISRVAIGYTAACILGISLGMATGSFKWLELSIGTIIQTLRPLPAIALVPFAVLWFGIGETSKCFLILWGSFFPIWIATHLGIRKVNVSLIRAAASLGASRSRIFFCVLLPASTSYIIAGMRIAIAISFVCLVAAEIAGASAGLGYRIEASHQMFKIDQMVAALIILGSLGAASDALFVLLTRWLIPWHEQRNV
jgi:ABC-type nitrate/sulfonate/bicarbonate transport system permease component